jgi:hypothetical protein
MRLANALWRLVEYAWAIRRAARSRADLMVRLEDTVVSKRLCRPSDVVLPCKEEIAGLTQVGFMCLPNVAEYVNERGGTSAAL